MNYRPDGSQSDAHVMAEAVQSHRFACLVLDALCGKRDGPDLQARFVAFKLKRRGLRAEFERRLEEYGSP